MVSVRPQITSMFNIAYRISAKSRARKHAFFLDTLKPAPEDTLIDIGANATEYSATDNYLEKHYSYPEKITVLTLDDPAHLKALYPKTTVIQGDGTRLPFDDNQFSISYSNAVIEHVGDYQKQRAFLSEMARVSTRGYLTTPNRLFPIEVHTRIPLLHLLLPKKLFDAFLRAIGKGWAADEYMSLLSKNDLQRLIKETDLPHAIITHHRFCGFTMTYTLTWNK